MSQNRFVSIQPRQSIQRYRDTNSCTDHSQTREVEVDPSPQGEVVRTPVTPGSSEALSSLQNLIKRNAHALDEPSKQRLYRHLQTFANAAQVSFAKRTLQQDHIQFPYKTNNEAKARQKTKSEVFGKAKVMSYENIEAA